MASCLNPRPSGHSAHTSSAGNKPGASSPGTSAGARPSAPPSGDAAQSAPERDPTAPPRSALSPNRWCLRLTLSQELLAPREHLLHRITQDRKGGLLRHRQGSFSPCQSLSDQAEKREILQGFSLYISPLANHDFGCRILLRKPPNPVCETQVWKPPLGSDCTGALLNPIPLSIWQRGAFQHGRARDLQTSLASVSQHCPFCDRDGRWEFCRRSQSVSSKLA